jgi:hypothetical protein
MNKILGGMRVIEGGGLRRRTALREVLSDLLGLSDGQISALRDRRVIAGPIEIE